MNSFEFNKIAGAVLGSALLLMLLNEVSGFLGGPKHLDSSVLNIDVEAAADASATAGSEETVDLATLLAGGDAEKGKNVAKKCTACHTFESGGANKIGPNLFSIVGADIAAKDGFSYSDVLLGLEGDWTYEQLNAFLANPKGFAKGTKMAFNGLKKDGDRADMILYLLENHDSPPPLPE